MWRWSFSMRCLNPRPGVFSTYVEVILAVELHIKKSCRILHVCGGDPSQIVSCLPHLMYSPRMWRWSWCDCWLNRSEGVFSTYVEVIPSPTGLPAMPPSILHVCGGDPYDRRNSKHTCKYSPRMWRWSPQKWGLQERKNVFSTYVEVIPCMYPRLLIGGCILHVCGGDPFLSNNL